MLNRAEDLNDLRVPPGNRLEALKGKKKELYSIRINDQWRICFIWQDKDTFDVEITDYHQEKIHEYKKNVSSSSGRDPFRGFS